MYPLQGIEKQNEDRRLGTMPYREIRPRGEEDRGEGSREGAQGSGTRDITREEARMASERKYRQTKKGKEVNQRALKRYRETEKGKANKERANEIRNLDYRAEKRYGQSRMDITLNEEQRSTLRRSAAKPDRTAGQIGVLMTKEIEREQGKTIIKVGQYAGPEHVRGTLGKLIEQGEMSRSSERTQQLERELASGSGESDDTEDSALNKLP
jgi:hypothetical protein